MWSCWCILWLCAITCIFLCMGIAYDSLSFFVYHKDRISFPVFLTLVSSFSSFVTILFCYHVWLWWLSTQVWSRHTFEFKWKLFFSRYKVKVRFTQHYFLFWCCLICRLKYVSENIGSKRFSWKLLNQTIKIISHTSKFWQCRL